MKPTLPLPTHDGRVERVAQGGTELGRSRLGFFQRLRNGGAHQQAGIPGMGAEGGHAALAVGRFIRIDIGHRGLAHRMRGGELRGDQHRAGRQEGAFDVLAADAQEVGIGHAMRLVHLAGVAAFLQGFLRQRSRGS